MEDFEDALLRLGLVQAKQTIEGGLANVGRLRRYQQALVKRLGCFGISSLGSGFGAAKGCLSYRGLKLRLRVFGKCGDAPPGFRVANLPKGGDGCPGDG